MKRSLIPILFCTIASTGCFSMSGVGGGSSYACKAPDGVSCESISGTWANAVAGNLPAQRAKNPSSVSQEPTPMPQESLPPAASGRRSGPLRAQAHTLRLWMKPWVDKDGDLYEHAFLYIQINDGRWLVEHIERPVREAYAPLRAPAGRHSQEEPSSRLPSSNLPSNRFPGD